MNYKNNFLIIGILGLVIFASSLFVVSETNTVFVVEFGKIVKKIDKAGLYLRVPGVHEIVVFDKRLLQVDSPAKEIIASDQKRLIVDAYAKYKIVDTQKFYESLQNEGNAIRKISSILDSSMRQAVAKYPLLALITDKRNEVMDEIKSLVITNTANFGVEIIDVRIIRADLPIENSDAIFQRMVSDRQKEATELRAEGDEVSQGIMSDADKQVKFINSDAFSKSQEIIGKGEAQANMIQARAFSKDPEFFNFYKSMEVLDDSLSDKKLILSNQNDVLKFLK